MPNYSFLLLISAFLCNLAYSQKCNCNTELKFVIDYYERNLPGFKDNVTPETKPTYEKLKQTLLSSSKTSTTKVDCFKTLTHYVEFFKDNHSSIYMQTADINERDDKALKKFYKSDIYKETENITLQEADLKVYAPDDIRGIYQIEDSTYVIAIVPNQTAFRDYVGIILFSKSKLWTRGQVKMELKQKDKGKFEAFVYMRNHSLSYRPHFNLNNGVLGDTWFKTNLKKKVAHNMLNQHELVFKSLDDSTHYMRIPTFSGDYTAVLNSFFEKHHADLVKKPYLIIDVRNNGGGSDRNAALLLKYVYTNPIPEDVMDHYVTTDNLNMWERWYADLSQDTLNYDKEYLTTFLEEIEQMKQASLGSFIKRGEPDSIRIENPSTEIKRIAIITNKHCASSCETLLFWARESKKTLITGENSGGYVGYGENGSLRTPCFNFLLTCTMTRYRDQRSFEVVGIPPDYELDLNSDWIEQTNILLHQKNWNR